jgi:phosphonate transport system substrate-binding protein
VRFGLVQTAPTGDAPFIASLTNALSTTLGRDDVACVVTETYAALTELFVHDDIDVAWLAPALVIESARRRAVACIIGTVRGGGADYGAGLYVRDDSAVRTLADLRGTRVGWVDPWSSAGYLFPRQLLRRAGLDPAVVFTDQLFFGSHRAVGDALARGQIDVGAMFNALSGEPVVSTSESADVVDTKRFRELARTDPIPGDALCVSPRFPVAAREAFIARLCGNEGPSLAALLGGERFEKRRIEDYQRVREALEDEWGRPSYESVEPKAPR